MTDKKTLSELIAADVAAALRARTPLLWVVTREEARVERHLFEAAMAVNYVPCTWDVAQGLKTGEKIDANYQDPGACLTAIANASKGGTRGVWIMRDLPIWLAGPPGAPIMRQLRNLARSLPNTPRENAQAIIVLTPSSDIPPELAGHVTVINWPLPDRAEIAAILDASIEALPDDIKANAAPNGTRDAAIDAAVGLTGEEAQSCYARSLVQTRRIDPALVAQEKKRVIAREKVLEWYDPLPGGLDAVGGLDVLKTWLVSRASAYTAKARAYGLPAPKGALLVGIPGCGKSLTAKAIATAWGIPLLRLDLGALKSKFVGESEQNLRKAFDVIKAIGRCVVWLDEIEKALQGATSGSADGGVSSDALGAILSWMQERQGEAFVIATSNDVSSLPPELLRKGRFDEVWFVDLPTAAERSQILAASLKQYGRKDVALLGVDRIVNATDGFTGSEISALVPDAMFTAFADNEREITSDDLIAAAATVTPLKETAKDKIEALRKWSVGKARSATTADNAPQKKKLRVLDI
jgi:ATPase family associated with various cellular activities (AAA)